MQESTHDIELIERYFDDALSPEQTQDLKDRLVRDPDFRKLFDRERLLVKAIRYEAARRDLDFLKTIEKSLSPQVVMRREKKWYYYAAAASVALLALFLWMPWQNASPEKLYTSYFEPHPNIFEPTLRGSEGTPRTQAFQAYERRDYERAATLFAGLLKQEHNAGMLMLLGNANLSIGKTEAASENFRELINTFDDYDVAGKWYLSLCYLKSGDLQRAKTLLHEIANAPAYGPKAAELLSKLE